MILEKIDRLYAFCTFRGKNIHFGFILGESILGHHQYENNAFALNVKNLDPYSCRSKRKVI